MSAQTGLPPAPLKNKELQFLYPCIHLIGSSKSLIFMADFSVVLFQPKFMLFSEKNHVKAPKNQWVWIMPYLPGCLSGAIRRGPTTAPEMQTPSQSPDRRRLPERRAYKCLRIKHFHGVSSAGPHTYSL